MMAHLRYWGLHLVVSKEHHWADSRASMTQMDFLTVDLRAGLKVESWVYWIWKGSQMASYWAYLMVDCLVHWMLRDSHWVYLMGGLKAYLMASQTQMEIHSG